MPHHIDRVAGITDKDFLEVIKSYFNKVKIVGDDYTEIVERFATFLQKIRIVGGAELIFFKK